MDGVAVVEVANEEEQQQQPSDAVHENTVVGKTMAHQEDQTDVCRVCLARAASMRGLFHESDVPSLADRLMFLASIKMMPGDGLPSYICSECGEKLESAYKFKIQVEQADAILRQKLDSLKTKEELFFSSVDINLTSHKNDVEAIAESNLFLKDNVELLKDQKISDNHSETEHTEKEINKVDIEQLQEEKQENEGDKSQLSHIEELNYIQSDLETQKFNNHQTQIQENQEIQSSQNEHHGETFGEQELHEMMLNEINNTEKMQVELNKTNNLEIHEHNYVEESLKCKDAIENNAAGMEEINKNIKEDIEKESVKQKIEIHDSSEKIPCESIRRSQRKINQQKVKKDRDSDEESYFENLNLSSRLKKIQSEKVFFMCYLCDKQFLSKSILKEHMHSHEEIRRSLSINSKITEKIPKTPEKFLSNTSSPTSSKSPSSGKRLNICPHCGKEYLYIISYNKHLRQHEKEKNTPKNDRIPSEVSFHEDDDTLDLHDYNDNHMESENDDNDQKNDIEEVRKQSSLRCNICEEEFDTADKLKNHSSKHVEKSVTEQDLHFSDDISKSMPTFEVLKTEEISNSTVKLENPEELEKSISRHRNHNSAKYTCSLCQFTFKRKDELRYHTEQMHRSRRVYHCSECNKNFGNELTLKNHQLATGHKTTVVNEEQDSNKRTKRSAAKAAQRIIDKIKTDLGLDDSDEEQDESKDMDENFDSTKEEHKIIKKEQMENESETPKKMQRNSRAVYCETCNLKCPSKLALTRHMEQHVKDEGAAKLEKTVNAYIKEEDEIEDDDNYEGGIDWPMETYECAICKKKYSTKKSLLRHQLLHEEPNFECDICNVKFYRKDKLKAHYDKCCEKNPDQVRKCNICGDSFENNEILREHRAKHVAEGILTEEDLMEIEPKSEDKDSEKAPRKRRTDIVGLECTECNKHYTSRKGLLRHIQVHEGKKYLCDICPKKFYRREHLKIHVAKHNMVKPYKCPRCVRRFIKEEQLNNHLLKHDRIVKKPKESTSDGTKRFLCEICSKGFTQSTTLVAHLRAHNGIKPYVCEVCSRPFTTNAYLKMHMRTHTQERPYICQYCSRAFARADTLANHLTSHTGEAKYHCKYCPKNFRRLKSLKEHVFIHTGQRPYACPTCDRRFNNNGSRYAHSKRCKQNQLQTRQRQPNVQNLDIEPQQQQQLSISVEQTHNEQEQTSTTLQLVDQTDLQNVQLQQTAQQLQRIATTQVATTTGQTKILNPQSIKTITIARPDTTLGQQHLVTHQEILMPLILPFTVTLADVGEEVILSENAKIFTA